MRDDFAAIDAAIRKAIADTTPAELAALDAAEKAYQRYLDLEDADAPEAKCAAAFERYMRAQEKYDAICARRKP